ncbi:MAG: PHP domain-containing protein [Steroidobacteraceae bacterium]|jgi:predicted metal-dependent phosphoesterase TrpH
MTRLDPANYERIDLHTHSTCSDGTLAPAALVALAATRQVQLLALTDHDTTAGCTEARQACLAHGIAFLEGIELTALWHECEVHIVALGIRADDPGLQQHAAAVRALRGERVRRIAARLSEAGLDGESLAAGAFALSTVPTRTHLARALLAAGHAKDLQGAFDKWLGRGRPGYVAPEWPDVATTLTAVLGAGGTAVLAHPHRYKLSNTALRELCAQFKADGGAALEVSIAGMSPDSQARMAQLARRFDLAGSIGSDFHEPGLPWRPLGRFAKLPEAVTPVTACLGLGPANVEKQ